MTRCLILAALTAVATASSTSEVNDFLHLHSRIGRSLGLAAAADDADDYTESNSTEANLCANVECNAANSCYDPGVCNSDSGVCSIAMKADNTPCDDENEDTTEDQCTAGVCQGQYDPCAGVTCAVPANASCYTEGICKLGVCTTPVKDLGTDCDDDNADTVNDKCSQFGVCKGNIPPKAAVEATLAVVFDSSTHTVGGVWAGKFETSIKAGLGDNFGAVSVTSMASGSMVVDFEVALPTDDQEVGGGLPPVADLQDQVSATTSSNFQVGDDVIEVGAISAEPVDPCLNKNCPTAGQCWEQAGCDQATGQCLQEPSINESCDDSDSTTINDTCNFAGFCHGVPDMCLKHDVQCPDLGSCYETAECDKVTGKCTNVQKPNGEACSVPDGEDGVCEAGVCNEPREPTTGCKTEGDENYDATAEVEDDTKCAGTVDDDDDDSNLDKAKDKVKDTIAAAKEGDKGALGLIALVLLLPIGLWANKQRTGKYLGNPCAGQNKGSEMEVQTQNYSGNTQQV